MIWKVGDLCVANHFGHWSNSEIKDLGNSLVTVEFIDGNDVADVPISTLKPFGPFAVNQKGELTTSEGSQHYVGEWKVGDLCVVRWTVDKRWNNAKILHIFSSSEILVQFTDFGSTDFVTLADMRPAGSPLGADYVLFKSEPNAMSFLKTILKTKSDTKNRETEGASPKKNVSFALHDIINTFHEMRCLKVNVGPQNKWNVKKNKTRTK